MAITLDKAIEILELNLKEAGAGMSEDCRAAVQLSIEADRRVLDQRLCPLRVLRQLLPGEATE